jgi:NAD(P) transhydrogenase subunit beta
MSSISIFFYIISASLFILSIYGLSSQKTAKIGNIFGIVAMMVAIINSLFLPNIQHNKILIILAIAIGGGIGYIVAKKVKMTAMPQLVAGFHSLVGLAAVLIAIAALFLPVEFGINILGAETIVLKFGSKIEMLLGAIIGGITFSGSIIAFLKLNGNLTKQIIIFQNKKHKSTFYCFYLCFILAIFTFLIFSHSKISFLFIALASIFFGIGLIAPIGGADMPVVVSMLNSYSGFATSGIGFTLNNPILVITGALVGASGAILSYIMCKAMNRSIFNVIFAFTQQNISNNNLQNQQNQVINYANPEDVAFIANNSSSLIIVPGYGMAVACAQHAVAEITNLLIDSGISVKFAIHPVAGRMPGHMNVLLAEAGIDYEKVFELEEVNPQFKTTDVVLVIGANDVTNPAAKYDKQSPIYGMPILEVSQAKTVFFIKRSLSSGYAGVDNELFFQKNTFMVLGDAKKIAEEIAKNLKT